MHDASSPVFARPLPPGRSLADGQARELFDGRLNVDSVSIAGTASAEAVREALELSLASLARLQGTFAFAAVDERHGIVCLARDASGSQGLYFRRDEHGVVHHAGELRRLADTLPDAPAISADGLGEYLRFLDITPPQTIYDGLYAVPPGHAVIFGRDHIGFVDLQHTPFATMPERYECALDDVETRLRQSIADGTRHARSAAAFLSGGVDSALLCALGRTHIGEAITLGFDDGHYDESGIASSVAAHLGLRHTVLRPGDNDFRTLFIRTHGESEQPFCDPAGMATRFAFEYCRHRHDQVIDGTGAEILPGTMPARWRRWALDYASHFPRRVRKHIATLPGMGSYRRMFDFDDPEDLFIRWQGFRSGEIRQLTGRPVDLKRTRFYRVFRSLRTSSHLQRQSILQGTLQPDDRIRQASWSTGVPCIHPYLDASVGPMLAALPPHWCVERNRPKRLLRDLLRRHVPETLWEQPKHGFEFDFRRFMRGHRSELVKSCLLDDAASLDRLLSRATIRQIYDRWSAGDDTVSFRIWALLVLSVWLRHGSLAHGQPVMSR